MTPRRHTGTVRPHPSVGPELGWEVIPDIDADQPFRIPAFASTDELHRAGVVPGNGVRVSYLLQHFGRCARAVGIEAAQHYAAPTNSEDR